MAKVKDKEKKTLKDKIKLKTTKEVKVEKKPTESKDQSKDLMKVENKVLDTKGIGSPSSNHNHPEWYAGNEILTKSLGKINFNNFRGIANDIELQTIPTKGGLIDYTAWQKTDDLTISNKFPGIMTHVYTPIFGALNSIGNDAEEMSRMVYANMRRVISGQRSYDASTVLQYLLSVGSYITAFSELHRVLAATHNRQLQNKYFGERLVEALGYDYDDIANNYNSYITQLNMLTATSQTFILPKGISLFERWRWLNSSVFLDSNDVKAPLIAFKPTGFWKFDLLPKSGPISKTAIQKVATDNNFKISPTSTITEFGLQFVEFPVGDDTRESRKQRFSSILAELRRVSHIYMDNKDFNLIAADMLKTYGEDVHTLLPFDPQTLLNITYDPNLNIAAKNITYFPFRFRTIVETVDLNIEKVGRVKALSYVLDGQNVNAVGNWGALTGWSDGSNDIFKAMFYNPQKLYVYANNDEVDALEAMSLTKWITRYEIKKNVTDGNALVIKGDGVGEEYGLTIHTCGTEVIHGSNIYAINEQSMFDIDGNFQHNPYTTTYGLTKLPWGGSNLVSVGRDHRDTMYDGTESNVTAVLNLKGIQWAGWVGQWDSSPATYLIMHNGLFANFDGDSLQSVETNWDLIAVNPKAHYTVLDTESLKRHQEVALASMLGIGRWGSNSINSNRSTPGQDLNTSAFTNTKS